ncbi:hypothetical protein GIB67_000695 [Kingdonia uniflora]|uniref:Glycosyltransferase n=1 Tax=Kingdonia uniflora TaxID=39325 RepID=A0A7J7NCY9_9MAGN|nr:hypothetical protein GIB67_000695 [Kingdonia uniflora]
MLNMGRPNILVIPFPAQGHVMPLMELSHILVDRGFKITFLNTEFNHDRVVAAARLDKNDEGFIRMMSIPDGLDVGEDRTNLGKLSDMMKDVMPVYLKDLITKLNASKNVDDRITCVLADVSMGWTLEVASKMNIRRAGFFPAAGGLLAMTLHVPKLIEAGIIRPDGTLNKSQMIKLSPTIPAFNADNFVWLCMGESAIKPIFNLIVRNNEAVNLAEYFICNSFYELEPSIFKMIPNLKPIGPLLASSRLANFWSEDSTCLSWLDEQPARSVIYVAFGSFTVFNKQQFDELAIGLELSGKPFLWVVRPDLTEGPNDVYPDGFEKRVAGRGRMVGWAPQREVLAHPSIACFVTHCGWNSTMEGVSTGVPLLTWPYFADQFLNQSYICDIWKVGLRLKDDDNGIISRDEIKKKVDGLLEDKGIKARVLKLKEIAINNVSKSGASFKNFEDFVNGIK